MINVIKRLVYIIVSAIFALLISSICVPLFILLAPIDLILFILLNRRGSFLFKILDFVDDNIAFRVRYCLRRNLIDRASKK